LYTSLMGCTPFIYPQHGRGLHLHTGSHQHSQCTVTEVVHSPLHPYNAPLHYLFSLKLLLHSLLSLPQSSIIHPHTSHSQSTSSSSVLSPQDFRRDNCPQISGGGSEDNDNLKANNWWPTTCVKSCSKHPNGVLFNIHNSL
jgi:hypothetical protein